MTQFLDRMNLGKDIIVDTLIKNTKDQKISPIINSSSNIELKYCDDDSQIASDPLLNEFYSEVNSKSLKQN